MTLLAITAWLPPLVKVRSLSLIHIFQYTTREVPVLPLYSGSCGADAAWALYGDGRMVISGSAVSYTHLDVYKRQTLAPVMDNPNFRFVKTDICDREAVYKLFEEEHPDMVVNFAAASHVDRSIEDLSLIHICSATRTTCGTRTRCA